MSSERKPTALDEAINLAAELVCTADTQDARAEVRVLRELAEAYDAVVADAHKPAWDEDQHTALCEVLMKKLDTYREWKAWQEK